MSVLTMVPPGVVLLALALVIAVLPRRAGHALGIGAALALLAWSLVVPEGTALATEFLGFDAVLLHVDAFSRLMGMIFGIIAAVAILYSYASNASSRQTGIAVSYVATATGAVFAGDWLTLVFFWELMAVTSTLLVWHYGGPAVRAGYRYAIAHGIGGTLLMGAVLWHYTTAGTFLFTGEGMTAVVPAVMAAVGIGVNVGFVGLHVWLPDTYPRPHFAASVFLCVFTTKTGVYGMYRAFPEGHIWIAYMGGAMAVFGAFYALFQDDMRRLLSYHIQSQVGYMIAGVGIGSALATAGAFGHVFNHILYKALLFMTAGVVIYRTGQQRLSNLGGLASKMPITALAFTIAALSIAGFPGFNGFVSKGMVTAAAHYEHIDALFWLLMLGGVGTFMSFIKFGYYAFFHGEYDGLVRDANRGQTVAMLSVAALCVIYGVFPDALFSILPFAGEIDPHPFTISHITEVLILAGTGLGGFFAVKTLLKRAGQLPDLDAVYEPVTFYGTRGVVVGITELYAAVDRAAVTLANASTQVLRQPERVVTSIPVVRLSVSRRDEGVTYPLRAGIGISVLVLVVAVSTTLVLLAVY